MEVVPTTRPEPSISQTSILPLNRAQHFLSQRPDRHSNLSYQNEITFFIKFTLQDITCWVVVDEEGHEHPVGEETTTTTEPAPPTTTLVLKPTNEHGLTHVRAALAAIGLELCFHDAITHPLFSRIDAFQTGCYHSNVAWVHVEVSVDIQRITKTPVLIDMNDDHVEANNHHDNGDLNRSLTVDFSMISQTSILPLIKVQTFFFQTPDNNLCHQKQIPFFIKFTIQDITSWVFADEEGHEHQETTTTTEPSPPTNLVLEPTDEHGLTHVRAALAAMGLEPGFHDAIIGPLFSRVDAIQTGCYHSYFGWVEVSVDIQRITKTPVLIDMNDHVEANNHHDNDLHHDIGDIDRYPAVEYDEFSMMMEEIEIEEPLDSSEFYNVNADDHNVDVVEYVGGDFDDHVFNFFDHNDDPTYTLALPAIPTVNLNKVNVNDIGEIATLEGKECAICLEQFQVSGDKNDDLNKNGGDRAAIRLPCTHVFHETCIMNWFNNSYKCPLCRYDCSTVG